MCSIRVFDLVRIRAGALLLALRPLLDTAELVDTTAAIDPELHRASASTIALVGFGHLGDTAALDIVRALRRQGAHVIPYAEGWSTAPVGAQCAALLAGALDVLDASAQTFHADLRARLTRAVAGMAERLSDEACRRDSMARLGIIGESPVMVALGRWILKIAPLSDLPVLIVGETGTGKELIAQAIRQLDPKRCRAPFVAVNCAELVAGLAESELFGHRRGAFTGALQDRHGLIRSAHGGTLFLDEIGDLDPGLQAKLLRVLQEQRVRRVGDDRDEPVNIRVVAATNRDLAAMVEQGRFRMDLFYRLNLLVTRAPALAERGRDLELLVDHFLQKYGGGRPLHAAPSLMAAFRSLQYPGNVRQLENLVRHAVVHSREDGEVGIAGLPPTVWAELTSRSAPGDAPAGNDWAALLDSNAWSLSKSLLTCERQFLKVALMRAAGNQSATARLLGVTPRSIYNKIRKHRLAG